MKTNRKILSIVLALLMVVSLMVVPMTSVSAADGITVGKNYVIVSKRSGMALTVSNYSAENNAEIVQLPVGNYASQVWNLQDAGNGLYKLVNNHSGKSMNVPWASTEAGAKIAQWNSGNADNEKWDITNTNDGYYRITPNLNRNLALNVEGNATYRNAAILQWNYAGADNEKWSFVEVNNIQPNPTMEIPDPASVLDTYLDAFFYVENGVGKLRNEPSNGFWTDAEIMEVFIDGYERLGDRRYLTAAEQFYDGFVERRGTDWRYNGFNDDILWMTLATVRLYLNTYNAEYLQVAEQNFNWCYDRAWDTSALNGGLWWTTDEETKNACVNGPGALAALKLYEATGNADYYNKAKLITDWMIDVMYDASNGEIYDSMTAAGGINKWANTGNQGNLIGACAMLYQHTGDNKYLTVAEKAADLAATLGDGAAELLNEGSNSGDSIGGKGLLARWMGYYVRELNVDKYDDFINNNASSAWYYRNSDNLMWGEFGRPTVENIQTSDSLMNGTNLYKRDFAAWGCSAAVSWILNFYADNPPAPGATPAQGITVGKEYMIVSKRSGLAIGAENNSTDNNAGIVQQVVTNNASQIWRVEDGGNGLYKLVNKASGKSMNVPWASTEAGEQMVLWNAGDADNEKWAISNTDDGYYRITPNLVRNMALNVEGNVTTENAKIVQWPYAGADNEKWSFVEAGAPIVGKDYVIVSKHSGMAIAVENNSTDNNAAIVQMPVDYNASQVWTVQDGGNGLYKLVNKASGKGMNVPWASTEAGEQMVLWNAGDADNEKWAITTTGDGYCRITPNLARGMALNIEGASNAAGAAIIQWNYAGANNEQWQFVEANTTSSNDSASSWRVTSPDGGTYINVQRGGNGNLTYTVTQDGTTIVESSEMGMNTSIGDFTNGLNYERTDSRTINETYTMLSGKSAQNRNYCNEKTIHFNKGGVQFDVVVRAYDNGIAFRYVITANGQTMTVNPGNERTTVNLPGGATIWYMPRTGNDFMYEEQYLNSNINNLANGTNISMPALYQTGNKFALITEAERTGNYVGTMLKSEAGGVLRTVFDMVQTSAIRCNTPFYSPWRTVVIGSAADIMENTMVENLSPAPDGQYNFASWVKPGMSSWSWVSYYGGQEDPDIHKEFIDLAADMDWEYYILDEGWQPGSNTAGSRYEGMRSWFNEVRDYANNKGVKLFVWVDKTDVDTDAEREARFREWSNAGIVGIKVDFFYNESQAMLKLHDDIYADAAKYKLMVNVHGSNPPSGELRTWPNVIAREAIFGQEQGGITAEQYTLIPFIRAAVGTADVTEQIYSRDTSKTTMGFQIALSTLIENGLHSMGSKPDEYYSIPAAVSYYTNFPTKWDDLAVINANVGQQVNLARKTGNVWYAAGVSVPAYEFNYQPTFLDANTTYTAVVYKEKPGERQDLEMVVHQNITRNSTIRVAVGAGGGYAVKFIPTSSNLQSLSASSGNITLQTYSTREVALNYNPANTNATDVTWSVGDNSVAKITTTAGGVRIKGLKAGNTTVTATSVYDNSKRAVINVSVQNGPYLFNDDQWDIMNSTNSYVINGQNSVTITAQNGVIDKDVFALPVSGNFEITAKISGGMNARYQGGFIGVFDGDRNPYVSVGRRYHDSFNTGGTYASNHLAMMSNSAEQYYRDDNRDQDVYVRLVKNGNNFTGYYRFNPNYGWNELGTMTNAALANGQMYIGFYAGCGGSTNSIDVTFSEIKLNGSNVSVGKATGNSGLSVGTEYLIVSKSSGLAMGAENNSTDNNAGIVQQAVTNNASQIWRLEDGGNGLYKLVNKASGKSMNVPWASTDAGEQMVLWNAGDADNEKWEITSTGDGYYRITPNLARGMGLNIEGASNAAGAAIIQWNYAGADNEKWSFVAVGGGSVEAESGTLSGGAATVNSANCSGGQYVGNIGNGGTVTLNVNATAGNKTLRVYYASGDTRDLSVNVNGTTYTVNCPSTGGWDTVGSVSLNVNMNNGNNTIVLSGVNGGWAPNIDRIVF